MPRFYLLILSMLLAGPSLRAQQPQPRPGVPNIGADAAFSCALAHERAALRQPTTTVRHRQKMDRYDVKYYKLDLALENNSRNVSGNVRMLARTVQPLDSVAFELYPTYTIDSVVVNGRRSPGVRRAGPDVTAALPLGVAANTLFSTLIYYRGTAPSGQSAAIGNALSTNTAPTYGVNVTWSLSEPFSAHEWWPCKQVLTDKADSVDVWVTTSSSNKVGSNGVLQRVTALPGSKSRYEWKHRAKPIAYYLVSVAVAPYIEYVNYANPTGGPQIPIVNYVYNQAALNTFRTEIDRTPGFIENFSSLIGLYPFASEKYGHSMAPIGGGMEHQTMTTQDGFTFTLTAHELFHQWFGDNVTCNSWEDIWLNESFASYGEYLSLNAFAATAPRTAQDWMEEAQYYARYRYAGGGQWTPMLGGSVRVPDTTNVGRIFDYYLTYKKGATVVHMLRYLLNDDVKFFRALRTYQATYSGRTARTIDLQRVFETEAGRPLQYFFDQWFAGQGYPTFNVRWNQVGQNFYLRNTETVSMGTATPFFDTELDYRLVFTDNTTQTLRLRQNQLVSSYSIPVTKTVLRLEVDPNQWILKGDGTTVRDNSLVLSSRAAAALTRLTVYPNPCRETLLIADLTTRAVAEVTDATGRVLLRQNVSPLTAQLDTRRLAAGLYHLRLTASDGAVSLARFVRE
ncbi:T9SS type A sorting domain-containing protein [Hymenobacter sp. BT186]|uniref:Aminopeptidase N n=1 Tax=Hymenobacter telluris TaxID=2816474 RepID=A0A939EWB5_9BACT|nr:M1 family aminopeptidase [Hymenobacter telluris]MBO0359024.1 T9SS type A sorting domain-containing protein [Hymenobacter telluris]MBW3375050.1 T9SS type A sorting domain-containing protein [Hymenobacter norwichensis]